MKKLTSILLGLAIGTASLAIVPACYLVFADGNVVSDPYEDDKWWAPKENITWNKTDLYTLESVVDEMPKTIEAWIQLDPTYTSVGGAIFSNVNANVHVAGSYTSLSTNAISLEINTKGRPKLYHKNNAGELITVTFNNADVRDEDFVHLAVARDGDTAYCYLNGVLMDKAEFITEDFVSAYRFAVGNDYQEKRTNYFKGQINGLSVYADARTQAEILADMSAVDIEDENLMVSYDLEAKAGYDTIKDKSKNGNDLTRGWLFADTLKEKQDYDYSMMALGDTQALNYYRQNAQGLTSYDNLFDYIVANAENQKVQHIFTLGDICQKASADEFANAKRNYAKLDTLYEQTGISYSVLAGNHDFSSGQSKNWNGVFGGSDKGYAKQYFASSNPSTALTTAHKFSAGELDYLVVAISWLATAEDIAWADEIIAAHPYHNVIITTHGYTNAKGTRTSLTSYIEEGEYNWVNALDTLVHKYENIVLTLNGHHPTTAIESFTSYGVHGNKITSLVIDPTYFDGEHATATVPHFSNGAGMIAYLRFSEGGSKVSLSWYSAINEQYYNSGSVYSIEIPTVARRQLSVNVNGYGGNVSQASVTMNGNATEAIQIPFIPNAGYRLSKLTLDGVDVTANVVDNVYSMSAEAQWTGKFLVAEFAVAGKPITVQNDAKKGEVVCMVEATEFLADTAVDFMITPKSGWKVVGVTFNGTALQKNADGTYTVTTTSGDNVLSVAYEETMSFAGTSALSSSNGKSAITALETTGATTSNEEAQTGCNATVGLTGFGMLASAFSAILAKKRRK